MNKTQFVEKTPGPLIPPILYTTYKMTTVLTLTYSQGPHDTLGSDVNMAPTWSVSDQILVLNQLFYDYI